MTRRPDDLLLGVGGAPDVRVPGRVARFIAEPLADMVNEKLDKSSRPDRAVDPDVLVTVEALRIAAERYGQYLASTFAADGNAEIDEAETLSPSFHDHEIGVSEAADILGCGERNVRYHAERGNLPGRKIGRWVFDRVDLLEFVEFRRSA